MRVRRAPAPYDEWDPPLVPEEQCEFNAEVVVSGPNYYPRLMCWICAKLWLPMIMEDEENTEVTIMRVGR